MTIERSRCLIEALEAAGKAHRYVDGHHHLSLPSHRQQFLEVLDAFLAVHLRERAGGGVKHLSERAAGAPMLCGGW